MAPRRCRLHSARAGIRRLPCRTGDDFAEQISKGARGSTDLTREAERFIDANRDRPFFLYLAHNNPHIPFRAARPELIESNRDAFEPAYAATIQTLDDSVGRLLAHLDATGLRDRTIVIFTSDNGGLHVPEGPHPRVTHNTPYRAGKGYVFEGGLRVPLIVRGPGLASRRVVDAPFVNVDWLPTLLELARTAVPGEIDGISQATLLRTGKGSGPSRTLYWHLPHYTNQGSRPAGAVREGDWKLVEHYDDDQVQLFNLANDIGEARNLAAAEPARTGALRKKLHAWLEAVDAQRNRPNPAVNLSLYNAALRDLRPHAVRSAPRGRCGMAESGGVAQTHERCRREAGAVGDRLKTSP